jgi:hypothetical protein
MTYTACDRKGHIVGGGITLGLQAKLGAIAECTRYAPGMVSVHEKEEMLAYANELVEQNQPLALLLSQHKGSCRLECIEGNGIVLSSSH